MLRDPHAPLAGTAPLDLGGGLRLDLARGELLDAAGRPSELRAQSLQVLRLLGESAGQVVSKEELMRRVWGDVVVTDDSLVQAIRDIRRTLGDEAHRVVRTLPRRGYLLVPVADATTQATEPAALPPAVAGRGEGAVPGWAGGLGIALLVVAVAIAAWAAGTVWRSEPAPPRSLAVLPFASEEGTERWFVDGVGDDLGAILAGWKDLRLIGRGSTAAYAGRVIDPRIVGRDLGVRHLLAGRLRREGDRVRLTVELTEARSGRIVWADQRDLPRAELGQWVGDVAGGLSRVLAVGYGEALASDQKALAPEEARADDFALQGIGELLRGVSREGWERASRLFEAGLALDPDCVRCLGGLSLAQSNLVLWEWAPDRAAAIARADDALVRARRLAPDRQITELAAASMTNVRRDWAGLLEIGDRLVEHYPNEPAAHHHRCSALLRLGRFEDSIAACERAQRISPRDSRVPVWQGLIGYNQFQLGRYAQAEQAARASVLANPRVPFYWTVLAAALAEQGRRDDALLAMRELRERHADYRVMRIAGYWVGTEPRFLAGRDRIAARAAELGLPP